MADGERPSDRVIREAIAKLRPGKSRKKVIRKRKPREVLDAESAARHNARNAAKWSLWEAAGQLDQVAPRIDGAEVASRREERADHWEQCKRRTRAGAAALRAAVAELVTPEQLAALDERRSVYPKGEEYAASMFCTELSRLTGRTPGDIFREFTDRQDHASDMVRPEVAEAGDVIRAGLLALVGK